MSKLKVLIFDIETAPSTAYIWSCWQDNVPVNMVQDAGEVLCWCAKWLNRKPIVHSSVWQHGTEECVRKLHALIEEADVLVAHNGDKFDIKVMNTMFLKYNLDPPMPAKMVDTLKIARGRFKLLSNTLDYLGRFLGVGRKGKTGGFELWEGVLAGNKKAQRDMLAYNRQDVALLESVYLRLLPWAKAHPNHGLATLDGKPKCTNCGSEKVVRKGTSSTATGIYKRYKCKSCGTPLRGRTTLLTKDQRIGILSQDKT